MRVTEQSVLPASAVSPLPGHSSPMTSCGSHRNQGALLIHQGSCRWREQEISLHTQCNYVPRVKNLLRCSTLSVTAASQTLPCLQILGDSVGLIFCQCTKLPGNGDAAGLCTTLGYQGTRRRCWSAQDVRSNNNASKFIFLWSVESTAFWIQLNLLLHIFCWLGEELVLTEEGQGQASRCRKGLGVLGEPVPQTPLLPQFLKPYQLGSHL